MDLYTFGNGQRLHNTNNIPGSCFLRFHIGSFKAFGSNQVFFADKWSFIVCDINSDGFVDLSEYSEINNAAYDFLSGCRLCSDLDYDGIVDITDLSIVDNYAAAFAQSFLPW
jgi:hypothetical protein